MGVDIISNINKEVKETTGPILTIVIPTYNGEKYIGETLDSIIMQFDDENVYSKINVLISDNKSEDNTFSVICEYLEKYQNIQYCCNDENYGADKNFDLAVRKAEGEYVWILSDDDFLKPGSLLKVLNIIKINNDISSIYVNYSSLDSYTKKIYREKAINLKNDVVCKDGNQFFKVTRFTSSLVSTVIIRKVDWIRIETNKYYGSSYIHFAVLLESLINSKCYIISNPYLVERCVVRNIEKDWSNGTKVLLVTMSLAELFKGMYKLGYEKKLIKHVCNLMKKQNLKLIIKLKLKGFNIEKIYIDKMNDIYGKYNFHWLACSILMIIPDRSYTFLFKIYSMKG